MLLLNARDWFDWTNAGIGTAGLALTFVTLLFAKGAKKAATEARVAVYRGNSADDLERILTLAHDFSRALQNEQDEIALYVAESFTSACSSARERHRGFLGREGAKLELAVQLVTGASRKLQRGMPQEDLLADAQRVVLYVSSVSGVLDRQIEQEQQ